MFDKNTRKKLQRVEKTAAKELHRTQRKAEKMVGSWKLDKKLDKAGKQAEKLVTKGQHRAEDLIKQTKPEETFKDVIQQAEKLVNVGQQKAEELIKQVKPEEKLAEFKYQAEKLISSGQQKAEELVNQIKPEAEKLVSAGQSKAEDLVKHVKPAETFNDVKDQAVKLLSTGQSKAEDLIKQAKPGETLKDARKQAEKLVVAGQQKADDFIKQVKPDEKLADAKNQATALIAAGGQKAAELVSQIKPGEKLAELKEQADKTDSSSTEGQTLLDQFSNEERLAVMRYRAEKIMENLPSKTRKRSQEIGEYKEAKKGGFGRIALLSGLGAAAGGLAWNYKKAWENVPPQESVLSGKSHFYQGKDGVIFYKEDGQEKNPPVVFIHGVGAGSSSYEWRKNFETLSKDFHVYAYDMLGFGKSDRPAMDYSAELYVNSLIEFLEKVVKQPVHIVAASLSAGHAIQVAVRRPELIKKLVLMQPAGENKLEGKTGPNVTGQPSYPILRVPGIGKFLYTFVASRSGIRSFLQGQLFYDKSFVTDEMVNYYYIAAHQPGAQYAPLAFFAGQLNSEIYEAFGKVKQPVMMIWGRESQITPVKEADKLIAQNKQARLYILDKASLGSNEEKANDFNDLTRKFLADDASQSENRPQQTVALG